MRAGGRDPALRDAGDTCLVHGHRMLTDPFDTLELRTRGVFEPLQTRLVQTLVRPAHVTVDVGANIGYYTLLLAALVGPAGRVFAFEPEPECFALLSHNVALNGYRNVALERAAVSDASAP